LGYVVGAGPPRRAAGETLASIAKSYGVPSGDDLAALMYY
jgi:hypothetical protein